MQSLRYASTPNASSLYSILKEILTFAFTNRYTDDPSLGSTDNVPHGADTVTAGVGPDPTSDQQPTAIANTQVNAAPATNAPKREPSRLKQELKQRQMQQQQQGTRNHQQKEKTTFVRREPYLRTLDPVSRLWHAILY